MCMISLHESSFRNQLIFSSIANVTYLYFSYTKLFFLLLEGAMSFIALMVRTSNASTTSSAPTLALVTAVIYVSSFSYNL